MDKAWHLFFFPYSHTLGCLDSGQWGLVKDAGQSTGQLPENILSVKQQLRNNFVPFIFISLFSLEFHMCKYSQFYFYPSPSVSPISLPTSFLFWNNPLSPVSVACIYMGMRPSTRLWEIYQRPHIQHRIILPLPATIYSQ